MNLKKELRDWRNYVWIGMTLYGTFVWFLSWITQPQQIETLKRLVNM